MKNFSKFLAIVLSIAITIPMLALSAGAIDSLTVEEPQIISDTLQAIMETSTEETTRVAVWLKDIETEEALATNSMPSYQERLAAVTAAEANSTATNDVDRSIEVKRTALNLCYEPYTESVGMSYFAEDEIVYASEYFPFVLAELTDERIIEVSNLNVTSKLDYYDMDSELEPVRPMSDTTERSTTLSGQTFYTVEDNASYVNADDVRSVIESGSSTPIVRIGLLEENIPDDSNDMFNSARWRMVVRRYDDTRDRHATHDLEILHGIAPDAYFCYTSLKNTTLPDELDWLVETGVNVLSVSYVLHAMDSEDQDPANNYGPCAELLDRTVALYGITIVTASGNTNNAGGNVISGSMGLNVITVGNFNRATNAIDEDSGYNPTTSYYKPDICAPGYFKLFAHTCDNPDCDSEICDAGACSSAEMDCCNIMGSNAPMEGCCNHYPYYKITGTSQATPLVAASVALLMMYQPSLKTQPELVKAVLMAGVRTTPTSNTSNTTHIYIPGNTNYRQYGAGVLDVWNAYTILRDGNYTTGGIPHNDYTIYQTIGLQSNRRSRICFFVIKETAAQHISDSVSVTNFGVSYNISFYDASTAPPTHYGISIGNNINLTLMSYTPTVSKNYTLKIEAAGASNLEGSDVSSSPYAIAWMQYD